MFKRFAPKSLLMRSLLIIGLPLIIVQFISIWVFYDRHVDTITRRMANSLVGELVVTVNHLNYYKNPADLVWILSEVQSNLGIRATYRRGKKLGKVVHRGADSGVGEELVRILGQRMRSNKFHVDLESKRNQVLINLQVPGGVLEISTNIKKLRTITTDLFVMWSIGSSVFVLIIAALFMRNQVRPIGQLARAADSFGKGQDVPGFKPWGAQEVRRAATAFIIMRERINRQMQQRTEMLAGISHDLRTPLTRLKLQLAILGDSKDVEDLEADIDEMQQMVEEYLSFARGEGLEQAVESDLPGLLADIVETAQRNGHAIELQGKGALQVTLRPTAFRRCMNNLIGNAARFGDKVVVQAARRSKFVEICVDDNGPGIPEARREDVFRPFVRVEHSRNRDSGGAGLGLTIARDIIRGHGGDVFLDVSPLGGTRAVVRLPL